jgi:predicted nucleic acid-binding Zn ribbon protein
MVDPMRTERRVTMLVLMIIVALIVVVVLTGCGRNY